MGFRFYKQFFCSCFMLPEKQKYEKEAREKCNMPCFHDQFELWAQLIQQSYKDRKNITVKTLYRNKIRDITGVVMGLILGKGLLRLSTDTGEKRVKIHEIRSIE